MVERARPRRAKESTSEHPTFCQAIVERLVVTRDSRTHLHSGEPEWLLFQSSAGRDLIRVEIDESIKLKDEPAHPAEPSKSSGR